jgi:2,3-bisphosphoglycerate-dependent phosphoglycerate mutase
VVAHGNSNRSIVMEIEKLTPEQILEVNLGTAVPLVYEMDTEGNVLSKTIIE